MLSLISGLDGSIVKPFTPLWQNGGKMARPGLKV